MKNGSVLCPLPAPRCGLPAEQALSQSLLASRVSTLPLDARPMESKSLEKSPLAPRLLEEAARCPWVQSNAIARLPLLLPRHTPPPLRCAANLASRMAWLNE